MWNCFSPYGGSNKVVVQGIFSHTEVSDGGPWGIMRESKFVFIGKIDDDLRKYLEDGLEKCLADGGRYMQAKRHDAGTTKSYSMSSRTATQPTRFDTKTFDIQKNKKLK